jgi:hypothetical protein
MLTNPASAIREARDKVALISTPRTERPWFIRDQYSAMGWFGAIEPSWHWG